MLSILIPVYNFDIRSLVGDLHQQGLSANIPFEILCFDDGSTDKFKKTNREITDYQHVVYKELPQNLGRSKIRNELALAAKYNYLMFMDCDSKVVKADFLKSYIDRLAPNTLLYGGRCYQVKAPKAPKLQLHWKYGTEREARSAEYRQKQAYHSFMTNNFLVPKAVFEQIRFDESLIQYGHEDTLFGLELMQKKVLIVHFDNPLEHIGLEDSDTFLRKTSMALENLVALSKDNKNIETRLLKFYHKINRFGLNSLFLFFYQTFKSLLLNNLRSKRPSLLLFDIYKLAQLAKIKRKSINRL